jgi:ComF family protein
MLFKIKKTLLDIFFPIRCLGCGKFDDWICADCHKTLPILTEQHCPFCKKMITKNGEICFSCQKKEKPALAGVFIASTYQSELLKSAVHYYKYKFIKKLAEPLALLIAQALQNSKLPTPDLIIPVPLHQRRLRWRGFNQAEVLAQALDLEIPLSAKILKRKNYTTPQVKMKNRKQRLNNLNGAFEITNPEKIKDKNILLIDDIITTGTTLSICANILKQAGAKKVSALVIARE